MLVKPRVVALRLVSVLLARPGQLLPKPIEIGLR
jgi:hypothetical protein